MKRIFCYILVAVLTVLLPVQGSDVGKLRPVQAVSVWKQDGQVYILTDTGDWGAGENAEQALENLHNSTPAVVYLDTAEFLLISPQAQQDAKYLAGFLKRDVQVYQNDGVQDLKLAAQYLSVHGGGTPLRQWAQGAVLPVLREEAGRVILSKNIEKSA